MTPDLDSVREVFAELRRRPGRPPWDDRAIDLVLGIDDRGGERAVDPAALRRRHGYEQYAYLGVGYRKVGFAYHRLDLGPEDVVYDLGCGYGRLLFYGALATRGGRFKGIELVESRLAAGREACARLGLEDRVELHAGNVLDFDLSDGTVFLVLNAFSNETLARVLEHLRETARRHPVRVLSVNWSNLPIAEQGWLREVPLGEVPGDRKGAYGLRLFASRDARSG